MNKKFRNILDTLASIQLTLICLAAMMVLVFFGTLAQIDMGTFAAQRMYFNSFWIWKSMSGIRFPIFPGGLTVGGLWLINLVAAFVVKFRYNRKESGLLISHFGLILLLAGQGLTQLTAHENIMSLQEGQTGHFVESSRDVELVFVMTSDPNADQILSIPYSIMSRQKTIQSPVLPFTVRILQFFPNAELKMGNSGPSLANQGIGAQISVNEMPITRADGEMNNVTAYVQISDGDTALGTWLVSLALGAPQSFILQGKEYKISIRPRREYLPYQITLKDFRHDIYPGTSIPKNFSSLVHLRHPQKNEDRDVLIYMNHPLRYDGRTFYQSSFGENDTLSVFQVVENPVWLAPYISCFLVVLGLAMQFLKSLRKYSS